MATKKQTLFIVGSPINEIDHGDTGYFDFPFVNSTIKCCIDAFEDGVIDVGDDEEYWIYELRPVKKVTKQRFRVEDI